MKPFVVDFIGIGAAKCGTTWIADVLRQHPQVEFSTRKEINYFNRRSLKGKINKAFDLGLDYYRSFWPKTIGPKKKVGEISPWYIYDEEAPKKIKKTYPNTKIIIALRQPVQRTYSQYLSEKNNLSMPQNTTFEQAVKKYPYIVKGSEYHHQLKRYFDLFPKKNIKVVLFDEIRDNPKKTIEDICTFLGIKKNFKADMSPSNPSEEVKIAWIKKSQDYLFAFPRHAVRFLYDTKLLPSSIVQGIAKSKLTRAYENVTQRIKSLNYHAIKKPKMNPDTKSRLQKHFLPDIKKTEKLIGKSLAAWK